MTGVLQTNSLFSRFAVLGAHPDLHEIFCVFRSRDLQSHQSNPIQSNQIQPWAPWCPQAPPGSPPSLRVGPLGPPRDPGVGPRCEAPLRCGVARSAIYTDMCFCSPAPMRGLLLENHGHEHKIGYVRTYVRATRILGCETHKSRNAESLTSLCQGGRLVVAQDLRE
jgi:hypothetical protein